MSDASETQDALTQAQNDLKSLDRVSHRLALLTDDKLPEILDKLLPRLLCRVGDNHQALVELSKKPAGGSTALLKQTYDASHAKLIETLSHVMKRARVTTQCTLPCQAILEILVHDSKPKDKVDPFTLNLSLAFLTIGLPRSTDYSTLLPSLLILYGYSSYDTYYLETTSAKRMQSNQFAHLLLKCLEGIVEQEQQKQKPTVMRQSTRSGEATQQSLSDSFLQAKQLLQSQDTIAASLYDLLLDVLLFQPTRQDSPIPPDGLSASAAHRLATGHSATARDWLAEVAIAARRSEVKLRLLDLIAPSRVWALLLHDNGAVNDEDTTMGGQDSAGTMNLSRTLALLVVASGDSAMDVADRAKGYLKMYFDSFRGKSLAYGLGDVIALSSHFLALSVGEQQADAAIKYIMLDGATPTQICRLGTSSPGTSAVSLQAVLNTKRRPLSESSMTAVAQFVATNVLQDQPNLFDEVYPSSLLSLSTLANLLARRTLSNVNSVSGLTKLKSRPFVAAADLLNSLAIRLVTYYDSQPDEKRQSLNESMAEMMAIACNVLDVVASRPSTNTANQRTVVVDEGNVAVRDACYGVLCTLCRSQLVQLTDGCVFNCGHAVDGHLAGNFAVSVSTAKMLFSCAANEEEKLRHRAVAALDALLAAYCRACTTPVVTVATMEVAPHDAPNPWASDTPAVTRPPAPLDPLSNSINKAALSKSLLPLLWTAAQAHVSKACRIAGCRWASQLLFDFDRTSACHLLCFLAGDIDPSVASAARDGLGLRNMETDTIPLVPDELRLPNFSQFVSVVLDGSVSTDNALDRRQRFWDFSQKGKAATLRLGLLALLNDFYEGDEGAMSTYLSTVCTTLKVFMNKTASATKGRPAIDLLDESSLALLTAVTTSAVVRQHLLMEKVDINLDDLLTLSLDAESSRARQHLAGVAGRLFEDTALWNKLQPSSNTFGGWIVESRVDQAIIACNARLSSMTSNRFPIGQVHGSAYLGAHALRACRMQSFSLSSDEHDGSTEIWESLSRTLIALSEGILHNDEVIGNACSDALSISFSYDWLDAPVMHQRLYASDTVVLSGLAKAIVKFADGNTVEVLRALKLTKAAGVCLGSTASCSLEGTMDCVNAVFGLLGSNAFRQNEEVGLVAGEALALYADARSTHGLAVASVWPATYDEVLGSQMEPAEHVLYVLLRRVLMASNPIQRTACAPALLAVVARVAREINDNPLYAKRNLTQVVITRLGDVQQAFIQLLSDPKVRHLSRESCCLGLAACRGIAGALTEGATSDELNRRLLGAFGHTTQYAGSAMMETPEQAAARRAREIPSAETATEVPEMMEQFGFETEVGGVANMGEAALGAYREMAGASVALGRDDILYTLLFLSVSHPAWSMDDFRDRYNAASLLGPSLQLGPTSNAKEMREILRPQMGKLIPRILRARYDPNKQTREQMTSLWNGLSGGGADGRDLITQHFITTFDLLLIDTSNKLWRARCGALGALADVIVGRTWQELGGGGPVLDDEDTSDGRLVTAADRLLRLWRTATRALDDVRGAVRDAGEVLARGVRALTIRLCDPDHMSPHRKRTRNDETSIHQRSAAAAAATSLRWLCRYGMSQPCVEATGICISTLIEIISLSSISTLLQPVLPELIKSLLLAMSGLEPAALNYLQLRTDNQEGLERIRLQLAQSGPLASALSKCLDIVPNLDDEHQRQIVPQLESALRLSAGFATRAAVADAVSTLCSSCPSAFRYSGPVKLNPAVRLLRAFYFASERERGDGSKDKMIHALGNLAALCPGASVRSLAVRACERYSGSTGSSDDPSSRRSSAAALRAIATRASSQFSEGNVWGDKILPTAFLGCKDADKKTASYWKEVWDEGGASFSVSDFSASDTYGTRLEEQILHRLINASVHALQDVSWSRRVAGATAIGELSEIGVLNPLPASTSNGKEPYIMGRARHRSEAASSALHECVVLLSKPRLWTGKGDVVNAAVQLASKWATAELLAGSDSKLLYGWNDPETPCPWKPVTLESACVDHLIMDDKWFVDAHITIEMTTDEGNDIVDQMNVDPSDETQIDMSDYDTAFANETENEPTQDIIEKCNFTPVVFVGLCRLLLQHGLTAAQSYSEYSLPYRTCALKGLKTLLSSVNGEEGGLKISLYSLMAPSLFAFLDESEEKPVLLAAALECLGQLFYKDFKREALADAQDQSASQIMARLKSLGGESQTAWTVRQASTQCLADLVKVCETEELRLPSTISLIMQCVEGSIKDKFWKVRLASVMLLQALVSRAGTSAHRNLLVLESILPHKETIMRQLRSSLRDSEAPVTALASEVVGSLSWWP